MAAEYPKKAGIEISLLEILDFKPEKFDLEKFQANLKNMGADTLIRGFAKFYIRWRNNPLCPPHVLNSAYPAIQAELKSRGYDSEEAALSRARDLQASESQTGRLQTSSVLSSISSSAQGRSTAAPSATNIAVAASGSPLHQTTSREDIKRTASDLQETKRMSPVATGIIPAFSVNAPTSRINEVKPKLTLATYTTNMLNEFLDEKLSDGEVASLIKTIVNEYRNKGGNVLDALYGEIEGREGKADPQRLGLIKERFLQEVSSASSESSSSSATSTNSFRR